MTSSLDQLVNEYEAAPRRLTELLGPRLARAGSTDDPTRPARRRGGDAAGMGRLRREAERLPSRGRLPEAGL